MRVQRTHDGGRLAAGDTPYLAYEVKIRRDHRGPVFDADGEQIGEVVWLIRQPIPTDATPEQERRRASQGGCCGAPVE